MVSTNGANLMRPHRIHVLEQTRLVEDIGPVDVRRDNSPSRVLYLFKVPCGPQGRSNRLQMVARRVLDAPGLSHMRRPTGQPSFR
jgi:hypothetical protein